jgi:hypothetical protein
MRTTSAAGVYIKMFGPPAYFRAERGDYAVVGSASMAPQRQAVMLHDPQHSLGIDDRLFLGTSFSLHQRGDAPVAINWPSVDNNMNWRQNSVSSALRSGPRDFTALSLFEVGKATYNVRARALTRNRPSDFFRTETPMSFFLRATLKASLRILFSTVRGRARCSRSRTRFSRSRSLDLPTTSSSA